MEKYLVLVLSLMVFMCYSVTTLLMKYFTGVQHIHQMAFLVMSTVGSMVVFTSVIIKKRWIQALKPPGMKWSRFIRTPTFLLIVLSGVCTAGIIPTTTILYTTSGLNITLAMVPMKSVTVFAGILVALILREQVTKWQILAGLFALGAMSTALLGEGKGENPFAASLVKGSVIMTVICYPIRIFLMRRFLRSLGKADKALKDALSKAYAGLEQLSAFTVLILATPLILWLAPPSPQIDDVKWGLAHLHTHWYVVVSTGLPYAMYALMSVLLYLYEGSAIVATVANKLAVVPGGILVGWIVLQLGFPGAKPVGLHEKQSLVCIAVALTFLVIDASLKARAKRRVQSSVMSVQSNMTPSSAMAASA
jgi:drug/metabolite transporter (DMT)-like permease